MKKFYLALLLLCSLGWGNKAWACPPTPGTYSIGPTGYYTTITAAITDLSSCTSITGAYILELQAAYVSTVEPSFPINIPSFTGVNSIRTITIRPELGAVNLSITSSNDNGTVKLNGAKYVYFDGRPGGVGTSKQLTIQNTNTFLYTSASGATNIGTTVTVGSTTGLAVGMLVGVGPGAGFFGPNVTVSGSITGTSFAVSGTPTSTLAAGNTVTAGWTPCAVIFVNGASNNSVKYCNLKSANQNITSGTVYFSTAVGTVGNNNNCISYNDICDASTGTPVVGVYAEAFSTAGQFNSGDTISYNNIYNYYKSNANSGGLLLRCSSNWEVTNNSFYQTSTRNLTISNAQSSAINFTGIVIPGSLVSSTNIGNNNLIKDNYVGGTSPNAGGSALTYTGAGVFIGIAVWAGTTIKTTIENNTIKNISYTSSGDGVAPRCISAFVGSVDCINNTIGSQSSNSINFQMNGTTAATIASMISIGVGSPTSGTINVANNSIGGIVINSTSSNPGFRGISYQGSASVYTISNNLINSISTTSMYTIRGIYTAATPTTSQLISSNIISNLTQSLTGTGELIGIYTSATITSKITIKSNKIYNLSSASSYTTLPAVVGIEFLSASTANVIEQDTIYAIRANGVSSAAVSAVGIHTVSASAGEIKRNLIYDITNTNINVGAVITAIRPLGGSWTVSNNMISLSNSSNTNSVLVIGIYDVSGNSGTRNYLFNSIYISGSGPSDSYGAAIQYNCSAAGITTIKNNILVVTRTGGANHFYAIANKTNNFSGLTSDNNILNCANTASIGLWGPALGTDNKDFTNWKTSVSGESSSYTAQFIPFVNTSVGNLHIDTTNVTLTNGGYVNIVESKGVVIAGITKDFDDENRPGPTGSTRGGAIAPDIGADEVDLAYSGDDVWNGSVSDVWTNPANWSTGVPTSGTNAIIPVVGTNYPIITGSVNAKNVITGTGTLVTLNSTGTLILAGSYQNNGNLTNNGTINFNGSAAQIFSGVGTITSMNNLTVNNATAGLSISKPFTLTGTLTPTSGYINLNNADVTLRSNASSTARVGVVGGNFTYTGTGKFIIERYIPAHRAWRLLTSPVTSASGQTINASWQEGATPKWPMGAELTTSIYNPNTGYGTHISGGIAGNGFDQSTTNNPSMKFYNGTSWSNVTSSLYSTKVTDLPGYMLFVRGSRGLDLSQGTTLVADNTTLRSSGQLKTGTIFQGTSGKTIVGNPYASAIDFHQVSLTSGFGADTYYLWDPALTGYNSVGAWVTFSHNGTNYDRTVSGTMPLNNYTGAISANGVIESGAAFLINFTGTLQFDESAKTTGVNNAMFRPAQTRVNLLAKNTDGSTSINDGILVTYGDEYSNAVDERDAPKIANFNESFSSRRDGKLLAIERRKTIAETDTIFFNMTSVQFKNYIFEIKTDSLERNNLAAFLEDNYLKTVTPVSLKDTVRIQFAFNSTPASYNIERFKLVFKPSVKFTEVSATLNDKDILLKWSVEKEFNLQNYIVERSEDSLHFVATGDTVNAENIDSAITYSVPDLNIKSGKIYYYRIKSMSKAGVVAYSNVVSVVVIKNAPSIFVFPNPVRNNKIGIQFNNNVFGTYFASLTNIKGTIITSRSILHTQNGTEYIEPPKKLSPGMYLLTVISPDGLQTTIRVVIV
ncbi:MAG: hypothetical protein V4556_10160 [Bacteroidota bacterium]